MSLKKGLAQVVLVFLAWLVPAALIAQGSFRRGNSNGDTTFDISDVIFTLSYLFLGGTAPECLDAADANDDGRVDISDAIYSLSYLFLGGPAPLPPGPEEGPDPTVDGLTCETGLTPGYELEITLSPGFPVGLITGLEVIFDTAPGGPPLDLLSPLRGGGGGVAVSSEVRDVDRDPEPELVYSIDSNPFGGKVPSATILLPPPGRESVIASIRVQALSRQGVLASAIATHLSTGEPIVLAPDRRLMIPFRLVCAPDVCIPPGGTNRPPVLAMLPDGYSVAVGRELVISLTATDPDGEAVTITLDAEDLMALPGSPEVVVGTVTTTARWTPPPAAERAEPWTIGVEARDARGSSATDVIRIAVVSTNSDPVWRPVGEQRAAEGITLRVQLEVFDPDGDELTLRMDTSGLPPGNDAELDAASHVFTWTPTYSDGGGPNPFVVGLRAADGRGGAADLALAIRVEDVARPPVVTAPSTVTWKVGVLDSFRYDVFDEKVLQQTVLQHDFPPGTDIALDEAMRTVAATPAAALARTQPYSLRILAVDAEGATGAADVPVFVVANNASPVIEPLPVQRTVEGRLLRFEILAPDPDGDPVTLALDASLLAQPNDAAIAGRTFTWTPRSGDARDMSYRAVFRATDLRGALTVSSVLIDVGEAGSDPGPPSQIVLVLPGQSIEVGVGVRGTPMDQIAGDAYTVQILVADELFNVVRAGGLSGEITRILDPTDPNNDGAAVTPFDPQGSASRFVEFTSLLAGPDHQLTVDHSLPPGVKAEPSGQYDVNPGATRHFAILLPAQTLQPGVKDSEAIVAGIPFGGVGVATTTAFAVNVYAVDQHGNWNFKHGQRPGEASSIVLASDAVFQDSSTTVQATNSPQAGSNVRIASPAAGTSFVTGQTISVSDAANHELTTVIGVKPGDSLTVGRLENSYTTPLVTLEIVDPARVQVSQRFGTLISGAGAVTTTAMTVDPLRVQLDGPLEATVDLGGLATGQAIAAKVQQELRAQALQDPQRWAFQASFAREFRRYVLISGAAAQSGQTSAVTVGTGQTAQDLKLLPPGGEGFRAELLADSEVAGGFPSGTGKIRLSQGYAAFSVQVAAGGDPAATRSLVAFLEPQDGLDDVSLSRGFKVTPSALAIEHVRVRDSDANGSIDSARLVFSEDPDPSFLPEATPFSLVFRPQGGTALTVAGASTLRVGRTLDVLFETEVPTTAIAGLSFRTAVEVVAGPPVLIDIHPHYLPRVRGTDAVGPTGKPFLVDEAPPVLVSTTALDTDGNGGLDILRLVFSEPIRFRAGRAMAIGNTIDVAGTLSVTAGDTFELSLDGVASLFTFDAPVTGATEIAARLDGLLDSVTTTATAVGFEGRPSGPGRFVIRGGEGAGRTVAVTGGTAAPRLGFDGTQLQVPGSDGDAPDLDDFMVFSDDARDLLDRSGTIQVQGNLLLIPLTPGVPAGTQVYFALIDDFNESFIADTAGNDLSIVSNVEGFTNVPTDSGFIRIRDDDANRGDGVIRAFPGVVRVHASTSLLDPADVQSVRFDLVSLDRSPTVRFFSPTAIAAQGPAANIFPGLRLDTLIELFERVETGGVGRIRVTVTLNEEAAARRHLFANSAREISREFTIAIREEPPVADAGPDRLTARVGEAVSLDGRGSIDPNLEALTFEWEVTTPAGDTIHSVTSTPSLVFDEAGAHQVRLVVTDSTGRSSEPAEVFVVATDDDPARHVPTADAGVDQVVRAGGMATLDGRDSRLPLGDFTGVRFDWKQVEGPVVALAGATTARPTFTPALPGSYVFRLTVTDSLGMRPSAPDSVTLTVVADEPPQVAFVPEARVTVLEPPPAVVVRVGDDIGVILSGAQSIDDSAVTTFDWRQVGGVTVSVVANGDLLTFRPVIPDTYVFELTVTDNTGLASLPQRVTLQVVGEGATPPAADAGADLQTTQPTVALNGMSTADPGARFQWSQVQGVPIVLVGEDSVDPSFLAPGSGVYELELVVTDANGVTAADRVQVAVSLPGRPLPVAELRVVRLMTEIQLEDGGSSPAGVEFAFHQVAGLRNVLLAATPDGSRVRFSPPTDDTYAFALRVFDPAVNLASAVDASGPVTTDNEPPDVAMNVATSPPSGANDPTPDITGTAEPGATVLVFASADCSGPVAATGTVEANGTFAVTVMATADGTSTFTVQVRDRAGNASPCSAAVTYTHDGTPPGQPVITQTVPASPANDRNPLVEGTAEAGASIEVFLDASCAGVPAATGTAGSGGAFSIRVMVPADTVSQITVRATDQAGNRSPCSAAVSYTHDGTPPGQPVITRTVPPSPSSDRNPLVEGTAEAGASIEVFLDASCAGVPAATGTAGSGGAFSIRVMVPADTLSQITVRATDQAGNRSPCSAAVTYTHDGTPPGQPVITRTVPSSPSSDRNPLVEGMAEAGATVEVFLDASCAGAPAATGTAGSGGAFSIRVMVPADTVSQITVRATDQAGNRSPCSAAVTYDHQTPVATTLVFTQEPTDVVEDRPFMVTVTARDQFGNPSPSFSGQVTVAIGQGPPGAVLSGTTMRNAQGGDVTFDDLRIDRPGSGFTLAVSAAGLMSDETAPFTVRVGNEPPVISDVTIQGESGLVVVRYRLSDSTSDRCDVLVEFSRGATEPFAVATQAGDTPGFGTSGVFALPASPSGVQHSFLWNAAQDLPGAQTTAVIVRLTPTDEFGAEGAAETLGDVSIFQGLFLAPNQALASDGASDVVAADINGDARVDLVSTNPADDTITVHLQHPQIPNFFPTVIIVATGPGPSSVRVADFNRDGKPDLIVTLEQIDVVEVLLGDGMGGFTSSVTGGAGDGPVSLAVVDIDGDGLPDVATADKVGGTVSVLLQDPSGFFGLPSTLTVGSSVVDVILVDLDRDGYLDIAAVNGGGNTVVVFLQDPGAPGTFTVPAIETTVGTSPSGIGAADMDDDGKPDLVVANEGSDSASVLLGHGDATFDRQDVATGAGSSPRDVAIGDLDGDILLDLALAGGNGELRIQLQSVTTTGVVLEDSSDSAFNPVGQQLVSVAIANLNHDDSPEVIVADPPANAVRPQENSPVHNPDPRFSLARSFRVGATVSVAAGDFNTDGRLDIVSVSSTAGAVSLGRGNGALEAPVTFAVVDAVQILAVDADGDRNLDVGTLSADTFDVRLGDGNGGLGAPITSTVGPGARVTVATDFTLDGTPDLAVAADDLAILAGNGGGGVTNVTFTADTVGRVAAGDFSGDSIPDVAASIAAASALRVFTFDGASLTAGTTVPTGTSPGAVLVLRADGDGLDDVAVANEGDGTVSVFLQPATGQLVAAAGSPYFAGGTPGALVAGDFDGDGDLDLGFTLVDANEARVLRNDGTAGFADAGVRVPTEAEPVALTVAFLDGDRKLDLAIGNLAAGTLNTVRGRDMGLFADGPNLGTGTTPVQTLIADFNRDAKVDVAIFDPASPEVRVLLGDGRGNFPLEMPFNIGGLPSAASMGDGDRDGILDLIVAQQSGPGFFLHGVGDGTFVTRGSFFHPSMINVADIAIADVNRDGPPDFAAASAGGNAVLVFLGNGAGGFSFRALVATGTQPRSVVLVDVNGDGFIDLLAANTGSSTATVHLGNGAGFFSLFTTVPTAPQPTGVAAGDSNADGRADLAVAHLEGITFFPGASPPGTFGAGIDLETVTTTTSVIFSGKNIVGIGGNSLQAFDHVFGESFNPPVVHVIPPVVVGQPEVSAETAIELTVTGTISGGGCAVGHFEHLGGSTVQRAASIITILLPFAAIALLRQLERRRRRP